MAGTGTFGLPGITCSRWRAWPSCHGACQPAHRSSSSSNRSIGRVPEPRPRRRPEKYGRLRGPLAKGCLVLREGYRVREGALPLGATWRSRRTWSALPRRCPPGRECPNHYRGVRSTGPDGRSAHRDGGGAIQRCARGRQLRGKQASLGAESDIRFPSSATSLQAIPRITRFGSVPGELQTSEKGRSRWQRNTRAT